MSSAAGEREREEREGAHAHAHAHVSVTTIHMPGPDTTHGGGGGGGGGQFAFVSRRGGGGVRISVPHAHTHAHAHAHTHDDAEADAEVSNIDFSLHHYEVNMRHKKQLAVGPAGAAGAAGAGSGGERPMSWEGELSDSEMVIDTTLYNDEASNGSVETMRGGGGGGGGGGSGCAVKAERPSRSHSTTPAPVPVAAAAGAAGAAPDALRPIKKELLPELKCEPSLTLTGSLGGSWAGSLAGSPLAARLVRVQSAGSADSAVHSLYHSSPRNTPSLSRNNSDASHSSCYSYSTSSELSHSPSHSPTQARHGAALYAGGGCGGGAGGGCGGGGGAGEEDDADERLQQHQGISRQQLINSPCPICGDKISGFHYGIFSCESCKGFFKRTVQNRKNYMCLRGGACPVAVATRKKCPACRFDKCLARGMKLEAIREDRTRGGRSTYQCSYSLSGAASTGSLLAPPPAPLRHAASLTHVNGPGLYSNRGECSTSPRTPEIPPLLQEIMDVEHLWQYNEAELAGRGGVAGAGAGAGAGGGTHTHTHNPLLAGCGITAGSAPPDFLAELCHIADHRLYKIVKWCKSLPLFKNISIDDQICLLINSWCELLVLSCCYRGVSTPGEVRLRSAGACLQRGAAAAPGTKAGAGRGLAPCLDRMLSFTEHLRRLRVDRYEYVALKVIVLLTSDAPELREAEKVRAMQERALAALQQYTAAHSPLAPAKFGELLLRIPELQRTCQFFMQVGKEMLSPAHRGDGDAPSFNLLMELLRGDH